MGNLLNGNMHTKNNPIPSKERQTDKSPKKVPMRPPPPHISRKDNSFGETEEILNRIDDQLREWQASVRTLRGSIGRETHDQLHKMMLNTERDLHDYNQQVQDNKVVPGVFTENERNKEEIESLKLMLSEEKKHVCKLQKDIDKHLSEIEAINEEKSELLFRLSEIASARLLENNPAITDLNDKNRPSKLGELYSEIYDNEWTDAFEAFKSSSCGDEFAIETMHLTLLNVFDFCKSKADSMLQKTEDAVNFLFEEYTLLHQPHISPQHMSMQQAEKILSTGNSTYKFQNALILYKRWKIQKTQHNMTMASELKIEKSSDITTHVKRLRKEVAESMAPVVQEAYMKANWIDREFIPQLEPFLRKCIYLCWMMVVQSPSMCFHHVDVEKEVHFDKSMYREYTHSGKKIKFVVWPALLLHDNGPLVYKGVAEAAFI